LSVVAYLLVAEWNFDELQQELQRILLQLKETEDTNLRRSLLLEMRVLLYEADGILIDQS
jgi:hypothetical protein